MKGLALLTLLFMCTVTLGQRANPFDIRQSGTPSEVSILDQSVASQTEETTDVEADSNPFALKPNRAESSSRTKSIVEEPVIDPIEEKPTNTYTDTKSEQPINKVIFALLFLFALILLAIGINLNTNRFKLMTQSLYNNTQLKTLARAGRQMFEVQNVLLYVAFWTVSSIFSFLLLRYFGIAGLQWWMIPVGILVIYAVRHLLTYMMGAVYPVGIISSIHNMGIGVNNMLLAIPLTIAGLGALFGPEGATSFFIYLGIGAFALFYLFRQIKGILLAIQMRGFNPIYFFIYLCAFEIAPVLVVLRLVS